MQAVFTDDVLNKKRNSMATEIAPNMLFAARLLEHKPASTRPLEEVREAISQKLMRQQAADLAVQQGKAMLAQLRQGEKVNLQWAAPVTVTREKTGGLDEALARMVFQADKTTLPAYTGMEYAGGYKLVRIDEVKDVAEVDETSRLANMQKLRQLTGEELFKAYLVQVKEASSIKMEPFTDSQIE